MKGTPQSDNWETDVDSSEDDTVDGKYIANALVRGLAIIRCFDKEHPTLSLAEIAQLLGVTRSVPFRLVYTLESLGYLKQDTISKRYYLTPKVMELGYSYLRSLEVSDVAEPILRELRDTTGFSAHLGVLSQGSVVYICRVAARSITSINIHVGVRLPAHATAIGKAMLAYRPAEFVQQLLGQEQQLELYTSNTKVSLQDVMLELDTIRAQGYALSNEEYEYGIRSVAIPVLDANNESVAAINVAALPANISDAYLQQIVLPGLRRAASQLAEYIQKGGVVGHY